MPDGRVLVAFDDGPLEPDPEWTRVDDPTGENFPEGFVAGYDTSSGRQSLVSQTDTGQATVYVNDHDGVLDRGGYGVAIGLQIMLQLYDPVTATWEPQFRGRINDYNYDVDGSAVDANIDPINEAVGIECVDMFDYLNGYGLTPGLEGDAPPPGKEDQIYYAPTAGTVDDRMIQVLTNANIDPAMYGSPSLASGNVKLLPGVYDPDSSALQVLRDCGDAELPFIANIYIDRYGRFQFRGRYGRFDPDGVSGEPGSDWDFTRWAVGDGKAILADSSRAQMRVLSFALARTNVINTAICYPQGLAAKDMPNQVFANTLSITNYGKHSAPPMSDLLTGDYAGPGTITPSDGKTQCAMYAQLLVMNQKDPLDAITALQLKSLRPDDPRAAATWPVLTRSDISHIVNVAVGYPGGGGWAGDIEDNFYIERRQLRVRPLDPAYDYVELDLEVSPAVWSLDSYGIFPAFGS